ncbi:50S ribosomal protein L6 [Hornefia butyriciproducens]|jgi:large subunit ribosomal protein L6|uniref:Large ribosomal subunit protein uL6 n=1 Tax=Hornefia butyriciproducens TaxID=2652293 RepID=A0A6L5Y6J5_9FIRM|nr:50S ribosomal protein L6 [Hornefia butyriciproducens]MCI7327696.1 50S ribosomal protein L6 [Clostridiales bacterium]MCI7412490.1 50S ribosomal protein L6 [Clostridiales bacterium]MCI7680314.1 50S ribosomal protein L6 [Clostridiales bacterium]MDD6299995.1 50S ribosomal protein L6 [Hornefia butyriciproducens]MDD7019193.1 50S ribosomal protein L6 [Hornefia butyriciproducens]
MSRIGRKPVTLPAGVEVKVDDKNVVTVKGPKGELEQQVNERIKVEVGEGEIRLSRPTDNRNDRAQHGLSRALIQNMVTGVTSGYEKKLQIIGVGYRAEKKGNKLVMNLGFSHPVEMEDPEGITTETPDANTVVVKGIDKALVGNYAANIRSWRKPEPYKGKGIRYEGERVRRKEGKTGAKA